MKKLFTLIFLFSLAEVFGRSSYPQDTLTYNNVGAFVINKGVFFYHSDTASAFICPKGNMHSEPGAINVASMWLSAFDTANNLKFAGETSPKMSDDSSDFFSGPISTNYDAEYDSLYKKCGSLINRILIITDCIMLMQTMQYLRLLPTGKEAEEQNLANREC